MLKLLHYNSVKSISAPNISSYSYKATCYTAHIQIAYQWELRVALPNFIWLERRLSVPFRSGMDGKTLGSNEKLMTCLRTQLPFEIGDFRCLGHCEHAHFDGLFAHASLPLLATRSFSDCCSASLPFLQRCRGRGGR